MEQTNSLAMSILQTIASQSTALPKGADKSDSDGLSDFQKLLDEKAQAKDPVVDDQSKSQTAQTAAAKKPEKTTPAQKQENALERIKRLAEQGYVIVQPTLPGVTLDGQVYQPGEYVEVWTESGIEFIPTAGLNEAELYQLQQIIASQNTHVIDVSDPEVDKLLEATAPGAKYDPAALLEEAMDEEIGEAAQQVVTEVQQEVEPEIQAQVQSQAQTEVQPQDTDGDDQVELIDVEQAPQRIFHDVKAAPVKVGETELTQGTDEANVVKQVEDQIAQAIQQGESMVRVRINPENLGEVTVQVSLKADGIMSIAISARSDDTRALLERHAANLQDLLASRVRESVEVTVQRQQESQQNQQQSYDGHNGHAQDNQQERRRQREHTSSQDFIQQLRLGLIPIDGEF